MQYSKKTLKDLKNLDGKRVVLRCDFNVPIDKKTGNISDTKRIDAALETINFLLEHNSKIILLSHLSRIKTLEDKNSSLKSLKVVYDYLVSKLPNIKINFEKNNQDPNLLEKSKNMSNKSIMLLENTRFTDVNDKGEVVKLESKNNAELGKFWASLGDVFVNDAFGTSHRAHASNVGIASNIEESAIGFLVEKELTMLSKAVDKPTHPVVAIFGGAKIADKVDSIKYIGKFADKILVGGGMSYGFLKVQGYEIGTSLFDENSKDTTKELHETFKDKLVIPVDYVCAKDFDSTETTICEYNSIPKELSGFDIGPKTINLYKDIISNAQTVIWNGPVGAFENPLFSKGTTSVCEFLANATTKHNAYTVIGGGDSASAASKSGYDAQISHVSTGGGASLEFFSGIPLPGVVAIQDNISIKVSAKPAIEKIEIKK